MFSPERDSSELISRLAAEAGNPAWLRGLVPWLSGNTLHVSFIHEYFAKWFLSTKKAEFERLAEKILANPNLEFVYSGLAGFLVEQNEADAVSTGDGVKISGSEDSGEFGEFLVNEKNAPVLRAAMRFCGPDPVSPCRTLVLRGPSGSGKSHLLKMMHASVRGKGGHSLLREAPLFCAGISGARNAARAREFWRGNDALLLDDLQDILGEALWQNSLAIYIEAANSRNGRLVFTFGGSSAEFGQLKRRLLSRLEKGLILELREPDLDVRLRWLEKANRQRGLGLGREQLLYLARRAQSIPSLQGLLLKIEFFAKMHGIKPENEDLEDIIEEGAHSAPPAWEDILKKVAERLNLSREEIMSSSRRPDLVLARQISMHLCRVKLGFSYPELGRIFGGKDHSTVMHGIKKIRAIAKNDKAMRKLLTEMEAETD